MQWEEVLKLYPAHSEREAEVSATALSSDRFIVYATWKWLDLHRKNSSQPVYRYLYSKLRPPLVDQTLASGLAGGTVRREANAAPAPVNVPVGAPHACEIEYCMGNLHLVKEYAWTADDYKVSETMSNYFANFIKTYNPNGAGLPEWKPYSKDETPFINIDVKTKLEQSTVEARYHFLEGIYK
jgi:para-nitrobenzyl esterase